MNRLQEFCDRQPPEMKSDKGDEAHSWRGHNYLTVYDAIFSPWYDLSFSILEIGVLYGQSLRMWHECLPNARVYGIDIDPMAPNQVQIQNLERIQVRVLDQSDTERLGEFASKHGPFRVVIDDGSHVIAHQLASFDALWPHVEPGGFYVLEDMGCSYHDSDPNWPGMSHNQSLPANNRETLNTWLNAKIKDIDHRRGDIRSIQFFQQQIVIRKV